MPESINAAVTVPGLGPSEEYGYQQCVRAGNLVFIAGQTGVDEHYRVVSPEFSVQARQALRNVERALHACGGGLRDLVAMTVFLADMQHFHEFIELRKEILGDARATSAVIGVSQLAFPDLLIEIQAVGVLPA